VETNPSNIHIFPIFSLYRRLMVLHYGFYGC
jgi:hypothetical protein